MHKTAHDTPWPCLEEAEPCPWRFDFASRIWVYDPQCVEPWPAFDRETNPNASDLVIRRQISQAARSKQRAVASSSASGKNKLLDAAVKGAEFYASICVDGCMPNDYGGPLFLLPGLVIALYICHHSKQGQAKLDALERVWDEPHRASMARYIINHQQVNGGWGTYTLVPHPCLITNGSPRRNARCRSRHQLWLHAQLCCPSFAWVPCPSSSVHQGSIVLDQARWGAKLTIVGQSVAGSVGRRRVGRHQSRPTRDVVLA